MEEGTGKGGEGVSTKKERKEEVEEKTEIRKKKSRK